MIISAQGLSADPIFLVENISDIQQNKLQEIKKLLAKSLSKKISVEKVGMSKVLGLSEVRLPVTGLERPDGE